MILDDLFVILILMLIIRCWVYNMCMNNQINLILCFKEIFCFEYALICKSSDYRMVWLPWLLIFKYLHYFPFSFFVKQTWTSQNVYTLSIFLFAEARLFALKLQ